MEEAQDLMKTVEQLEKERERERLRLTGGGPKVSFAYNSTISLFVTITFQMLAGFELDTHDFHEKMELCDVCGSFLVIGDSQCRVDAHLLGKQHMGYARIRSTIAELRVSNFCLGCQSMTKLMYMQPACPVLCLHYVC